jgi:hypothetical protein
LNGLSSKTGISVIIAIFVILIIYKILRSKWYW